MHGDTNPAYFSPKFWHKDNRGARGDGQATLTHTAEWVDVYSITFATTADKVTYSPSVIESSAGQTSIPQAFAKHPFKESEHPCKINILCTSLSALESSYKEKCHTVWYHIIVCFSIFRRKIHFVPNRHNHQGSTALSKHITHSVILSHIRLLLPQTSAASSSGSDIFYINWWFQTDEWDMSSMVNSMIYEGDFSLCTPLLAALYSALIFL